MSSKVGHLGAPPRGCKLTISGWTGCSFYNRTGGSIGMKFATHGFWLRNSLVEFFFTLWELNLYPCNKLYSLSLQVFDWQIYDICCNGFSIFFHNLLQGACRYKWLVHLNIWHFFIDLLAQSSFGDVLFWSNIFAFQSFMLPSTYWH